MAKIYTNAIIVPARWELWMPKLSAVAKRMTAPAESESSRRNRLPRNREAIGYLFASSGSMKKKATALKIILSRPNPMPMRRLAATVSSVSPGVPFSSPAVLKNVELRNAKIFTPIIYERRIDSTRNHLPDNCLPCQLNDSYPTKLGTRTYWENI
jgi:hypothetical protein